MTSSDHEELRSQLGAYMLGTLAPAEQAEVRAHLAVCEDCAAEARALQPVVDALAWSVEPVDPPGAVRERVLSAIATPAIAPVKPSVASVAPRRPSVLPWLAAAASLVLAVGLGTYASQL